MKRALVVTPLVLASLLLGTAANATVVLHNPSLQISVPAITASYKSQAAAPLSWVEIQGVGFTEVAEVYVDNQIADFEVMSDVALKLQVPRGTNPGDAVVKLTGEFGVSTHHQLLQVLPSALALESKVTIGTFQGFAAVYTKNFKGKELKITIGNRQRVIPELEANFTQNLTKIGVGKTVSVMVFVDQELVQVKELKIE